MEYSSVVHLSFEQEFYRSVSPFAVKQFAGRMAWELPKGKQNILFYGSHNRFLELVAEEFTERTQDFGVRNIATLTFGNRSNLEEFKEYFYICVDSFIDLKTQDESVNLRAS